MCIVGAKRTLVAVGASILIVFSGSVHSATKFSDLMGKKDSWVYQKAGQAGDLVLEKIDARLQEIFKEKVLDLLLEQVQLELGEELVKSMASVVGIGPMLSVIGSLGNSGPSESQVMMQVLLEAINESKNEIIDAVEQGFQDETEADLNALIFNLDIFNSRSIDQQAFLYFELSDLSQAASSVKKRLEQKTSRMVDNSHLYMLVAGLHIEIQKQFTRWSTLTENPAASEDEISAEYSSVYATILRDSTNAIVHGSLGKLSSWRQSYANSFGAAKDIELVGPVPYSEVVPPGKYARGSYYFSYEFNDKPVKFMILTGNYADIYKSHFIFDATDEYIGGNGLLGPRSGYERYALAFARKYGHVVIDRHKADEGAFSEYVRTGYEPIKEIIDVWWKHADLGDRPRSEVDEYFQSCSPEMVNGEVMGPIPSLCYK